MFRYIFNEYFPIQINGAIFVKILIEIARNYETICDKVFVMEFSNIKKTNEKYFCIYFMSPHVKCVYKCNLACRYLNKNIFSVGTHSCNCNLTLKAAVFTSGASTISEGDIFIYLCSAQLISFEVDFITNLLAGRLVRD